MPKPKRGPRLGGGPAHQKRMLGGMAADLFVHGRIRTTHAKARTLRPYAEKLITKAKRGDLHARRQVLSKLGDRDVVAYLFEEVAPRFADRPGGYTRILKLGPRKGDAAPMAIIELVDRGARRAGEEFVEEARDRRSRGLLGRLRSRFGRGRDRAEEDDLMAGLDLEDVEGVEEEDLEEPEEPADAGAPGTPPPRDEPGPAKEPSAPDQRSAGAPVDTAPGGDAAGAEASGKDAGSG